MEQSFDDNHPSKSKKQLQALTKQNSVQRAKIKALLQAARRSKHKLATPLPPPSDVSGHDDNDTFSSDHEPSALEKQRAARCKTSKFVTPTSLISDGPDDSNETFSSDHESNAAAKRLKIESDNNYATERR